MPRKRELTYFKPRRRWKKKIKGKVYYFGAPCNKTDEAGYRKALAEYHELVEQQQDRTAERIENLGYDPREYGYSFEDAERLHDFFESHLENIEGKTATTISKAVDQFMAHSKVLVAAGERSQRRHDDLQWHLDKFKVWTGEEALTELNAAKLSEWHLHLMQQTIDKDMSPKYAADHLNATKQFVRHAWQNELIETMPRNIDRLLIRVPAKTVKIADLEDAHRLLAAADDRMKLLLALSMLCGMTPKDMSDLRHDETKLSAGTITRRRSKTRHHENVPTVTYKLPAPVAKLLRQEASQGAGDDRVLLTRKGQPLLHGSTKSVNQAFRRLRKAVNKETRPDGKPLPEITASFKTMRATSATMLADKYDEALADYWMAHAPKTIGQRHYIAPNQDRLDEAVAWLAEQYGLAG